jgi:hypothetical protein
MLAFDGPWGIESSWDDKKKSPLRGRRCCGGVSGLRVAACDFGGGDFGGGALLNMFSFQTNGREIGCPYGHKDPSYRKRIAS